MSKQIPWLRILVEGVVIVGSILLAFGIDAWWEGKKEEARRVDLLEALQADFTSTQSLLTGSLETGEVTLSRSTALLTAATSADDVPADSIRALAPGAFRAILFTPAVANYEAAVATGEIGLLESDSLLVFLNQFDWGLEGYQQHRVLIGQIFYWGPIHEIRQEFGSAFVLESAALEELPGLVRSPTIRAATESMMIAQESAFDYLTRMDEATGRVLRELERLLAELR